MTRWTLPTACLITLAACASSPPAPPPAAPAATALRSGLLLDNFDRSVRPQDDLYRFVNGTWLKNTEIPADKSEYGAFTILQDRAEKNLKAIAEEAAAAGAAAGSDQQRIGDFYASYMDEARAERLGLEPLRPELARIDAIKDRRELREYLARAQVLGIDNPISLQIFPDAQRPDLNTMWVTQGGFGLPERDYYVSKQARFAEIRAAYEKHISNVFALAGRKDPAQTARRVMAFEMRLAQASWPAVKLREIAKLYNPLEIAAAEKATRGALSDADHRRLIEEALTEADLSKLTKA